VDFVKKRKKSPTQAVGLRIIILGVKHTGTTVVRVDQFEISSGCSIAYERSSGKFALLSQLIFSTIRAAPAP
jgi:hypothetical protein